MKFLKKLFADPASFEDGYRALEQGDFKTAFQVWEVLANGGDARAQYNLAKMYIVGNGIPADDQKSWMWIIRSAENGCREAQAWLGACYEKSGVLASPFAEMGPSGKAFAMRIFFQQCWDQQAAMLERENRPQEQVNNIMAYHLMRWVERDLTLHSQLAEFISLSK